MTLHETATRLKLRTQKAVRNARGKIRLPRRRSRAERIFDEAKPVLRRAAPMLAGVAVEQFNRRWRGAQRKKTMKQEFAPLLASLAAAAAANPKVRAIIKDAVDAALPRLEAAVAKAKVAREKVKDQALEVLTDGDGET